MTINLDSPISEISVLGKRCAKLFSGLGVHTCRDLLFYFPYRFDDFSQLVRIGSLGPRMSVTVRGQVKLIQNRRSFRRRMIVTEALVADDSGQVKVLWFNQPYLVKNIRTGDMVSLSGKTSDNFLDLQLVNPMYSRIQGGEGGGDARILPIYTTTEKLSQKYIRSLMASALSLCLPLVEEWLPDDVLEREDFPPLGQSLNAIHNPASKDEFDAAFTRFQFEEMFLLQMMSLRAKQQMQEYTARRISLNRELTGKFTRALPFLLTESQKEVAREIMHDMEQDRPMNRLLEGDVGSGKTVVAALAALNVVSGGAQAAFMAPTELLAKQHYANFIRWFESMGVSVALVTSTQILGIATEDSEKVSVAKMKKKAQEAIMRGDVDLVIGTHALIQDSVLFHDLCLVVVDEQHRFGVGQRKKLREKGREETMPHLLSMTATPIPRSLTLALYGDLDVSLLTTMPAGRKVIITKVVPDRYRNWTYAFVRTQVQAGHQAFIVCPLIEASDTLGVKSVEEEYKRLKKEVFPDLRLAMLHGKMKSEERTRVIQEMLWREVDILISTSVVEVGIDIPNATVMLIEGAERFGLAQLHQFRGRVGRSIHQSYCFLLPTDQEKQEVARLKALVDCHDGFELAEKDLGLRGPGELYGTRQSGIPALNLADITNVAMIKAAREWASRYVYRLEQFPALVERVQMFEREVHLE